MISVIIKHKGKVVVFKSNTEDVNRLEKMIKKAIECMNKGRIGHKLKKD